MEDVLCPVLRQRILSYSISIINIEYDLLENSIGFGVDIYHHQWQSDL